MHAPAVAKGAPRSSEGEFAFQTDFSLGSTLLFRAGFDTGCSSERFQFWLGARALLRNKPKERHPLDTAERGWTEIEGSALIKLPPGGALAPVRTVQADEAFRD
jgi:hypothetical protein